MFRKLIIRIVINAIALYATAYFIEGIEFKGGLLQLLIAGLVLGLLNAFVKPVLKFLSCPLIILTLGLFYFIINMIMLYLVSYFVPGYHIQTWLAALLGSILVSIVNWILSWLFGLNEKKEPKAD
jgi:putative membrane protein